MSLAAAVGAPAPVQIGNQTYTASPVNLFQLGELEEFVRSRAIHRAAKASIGLPRDTGDQLMDRALAKADKITFDSEEARDFLASLPGMCFLIALSLRPTHPDMTPEKVGAVLSANAEQRGEAIATVVRISGFGGDGGKAGGGQQRGEARPGDSRESSAA